MWKAPSSSIATGALSMALGTATALVTSDARATSCDTHAAESFDLSLSEVTRDGTPAEDPVRLDTIDRLVNSISMGEGILLWGTLDAEDLDLAKFYRLGSPITPTSAAQAAIDESNARSQRVFQCGRMPFRAIQPGVYLFWQDYEDGSEDPALIDDPVVTIAADRQTVTLEFDHDGSAWTAVYEVDAAYFEIDERGCACSAGSSTGGPMAAFIVLGLYGLRWRRRQACPCPAGP